MVNYGTNIQLFCPKKPLKRTQRLQQVRNSINHARKANEPLLERFQEKFIQAKLCKISRIDEAKNI